MKFTIKIYTPMPDPSHDNGFKRLLRTVLQYDTDGPTVKEVATLLRVSESIVYRYCASDSQTNMPYDAARTLSRYLVNEYGDTRIVDFFNDTTRGAVADGRIDDENLDLDREQGLLIAAYQKGDYDAARKHLAAMRGTLERWNAEIDKAESAR